MGCSASGNAVRHIPAMYYYGGHDHDFCSTEVRPLSELDPLNLPTLALVTPNNCHNGHDCDNEEVDAFAHQIIEPVLSSPAYHSGSTALMVLYDEDHPVPNLFVAPTAHSGVLNTAGAGHAAMLKTWEQMLGLPVMAQGQLPAAISLRPSANI
jgi:hypothetical protein